MYRTENLKIDNYTGASITADMKNVFRTTINDAFTFYQEDLPNTTYYMQSKLEGTYPGSFEIIILK